jgi:hypothetical protein
LKKEKNLQENQKFRQFWSNKKPEAPVSLPRVELTRRAPCIYRTAAFENRTIGKTLIAKLRTNVTSLNALKNAGPIELATVFGNDPLLESCLVAKPAVK